VIDDEIEIEFDMSPRIQTRRIDQAQAKTVEQQAPDGATLQGLCHRQPPERIKRFRPGRDDDGDGCGVRSEGGGDRGGQAFDPFGRAKSEKLHERDG
jgi:hypothetical protein